MPDISEINDLEELPRNGRLCIYGTGELAETLFSLLARQRADVVVAQIGDTYKRGTFHGLPIQGPEALDAEMDLILIASMYWSNIAEDLLQRGYDRLAYVGGHFAHFFPYDQTTATGLPTHIEQEFQRVLDLLEVEEDRELYRAVFQARQGNPETLRSLLVARGFNHEDQYHEFFDFSNIEHVVEGGISMGHIALAMLQKMPATGHLIGFEPYIETYLQSPYRRRLAPYSYEVVPQALWSRAETLHFLIDDQEPLKTMGTSKIVGEQMTRRTRRVEGISLDAYVIEKGMDRLDLLTLDVEGSEIHAIKGARETLTRFRPYLAVALYHHRNHLYQIPLLLHEILPDYRFRLGHYSNDIFETILYGFPGK